MKLAISNIAWDAQDDRQVFDSLKALKYPGLEIAPTRVFPESPYQRLPEAKRFSEELSSKWGLEIASMQSIWYRRTESIFGSREEVESLIEYTKEAILFAEAVGCGNLVFGSPKNRLMPSGKKIEDALPFFRAIGDFAAAHRATIALEAVPAMYGTNFLNTTPELYDFVRLLNNPGIRMNLDFGTMLANGETLERVKEYLPFVNHVHISEPGLVMIEKREEHNAFLKILQEGPYDRFVSIEMKNQENPDLVISALEYLKEILLGISE